MEHSQQFLKQRMFYTVLPVIILPFLVLLFWLLGGGKGVEAKVVTKNGLNTQLPDANLKKEPATDKLSFYAMADRDSVKRAELMQMDPNYHAAIPVAGSALNSPSHESDDQLSRKIQRFQKELDQPEIDEKPYKKPNPEPYGDIEQLHQMVASIHQKKTDPDIEALNGTLDKLLEIQNPAKTKRETPTYGKSKVFAVSANGTSVEQNYFGTASTINNNGFLSDAEGQKDSANAGVIMAVVHNEQILLAGSVVKLRLLQDVYVNGEKIPAGSFIFGNASIDNERLKVTVSSIQFQNRLYPVALNVFDLDGLEGISIPGSAGRDVVKQSADQGIQSVGGLSFDPSLSAQAATVGINTAKSLLSKKVKLVRVTVKAGYKVLLKDENEKKYSL